MDITLIYWLVLGLMILGVIGAIIPGLPGSSLILIGILIWSVATGFTGIGLPLILIFIVLILSAGIEYLALYLGAKQVGASKWGQYGAIAGMALGFLGLLPALPFGGPLIGLLFGAILGAFIGEFLYRKDLESQERFQQAFKVSLGIVIGSIIGNVIEALLAALAVIIFVISTWPPVGFN
ncbi:protein of unknown function DUF456 [Stanieria cyanosphaera PCC 7437]|uniref:DUF456 domain-containing protein n=1 Tax=Stanieria cyanosphaera (strain ATCC 29371 / PCC 7437) TaxID=111780 RepID=K9XQ06_STAC7|nr:DUF456 family protein [Stanieria cyanosphaera]AFZ34705.1 protein of unknown function DUF456 [Stanieria cyanosphaera PCC 7437]